MIHYWSINVYHIFQRSKKRNISYCEIFQYDDDTIILFADKDVTKTENALNKDTSSFGKYCKVNKFY